MTRTNFFLKKTEPAGQAVLVCLILRTYYLPILTYQKSRPFAYEDYQVWLNGNLIQERTEDIPINAAPIEVTVKFRSKFDGFRYRITCPTRFHFPAGTTDGTDFYIALQSLHDLPSEAERSKGLEYVDISKICLYSDMMLDSMKSYMSRAHISSCF